MMRGVILLVCSIGLGGCSHTQTQLNAGAVSTSTGGAVTSSSGAAVNVQASGSTAAALIGLGIAAAMVTGAEERGYGTRYNMNPFLAVTGTAKAPELAPTRSVNEQDCTRPVADSGANLKCR